MRAPEELVFGPTVEGLFVKGLSGKLPRALIEQLKVVGIDLDHPLRPAYPRTVVGEAIALTAKTLYPDLSLAEAHYRIGKHVTPGQGSTMLGAATLKIVALVGPRRTLERMARTFRGTNNYMQVQLRNTGPDAWELELQPSNEFPSYMQAVIEDLLTLAGAKDLVVEIAEHDRATHRCLYRIHWR